MIISQTLHGGGQRGRPLRPPHTGGQEEKGTRRGTHKRCDTVRSWLGKKDAATRGLTYRPTGSPGTDRGLPSPGAVPAGGHTVPP